MAEYVQRATLRCTAETLVYRYTPAYVLPSLLIAGHQSTAMQT